LHHIDNKEFLKIFRHPLRGNRTPFISVGFLSRATPYHSVEILHHIDNKEFLKIFHHPLRGKRTPFISVGFLSRVTPYLSVDLGLRARSGDLEE